MKTKIELGVGRGFYVNPEQLRQKGFVGEVMWDIAFCSPDNCRDQEAYMELLEHTANQIIEKCTRT